MDRVPPRNQRNLHRLSGAGTSPEPTEAVMGHHRAAATANRPSAFLVAIVLALTGNGATAQTPAPAATAPAPAAPASAQPAPAAPPAAPAAPAPPAQPQATPEVKVLADHEVEGVLGKEVVSATNENMGRVVDVLVDHAGKARAAVIDFGGFLGVGSRKIAVDWSALHFPLPGKPDTHITLEFTRDQVKAAPEYQDGKPVVVLSALSKIEPLPSPLPFAD
jgi:pyruvate/2-oxoglutarate dehydrogenase complex dihydrolipoamide acyltransferase (E2) component